MRLETIKGIRGKRKVLGNRRAFNSSAWEFKKGNPDPNVLDPDTIAFRISGRFIVMTATPLGRRSTIRYL